MAESKEARRDALVEAAFHAIAAKGFEGLRLRDVAATAGIDHSTLHHYFPTKRDLVAAVVEHATRQFRPHPLARTRTSAVRPASLSEHLAFLARMIVDRPALHAVLRELDLHAARNTNVRAIIAKHEKGWRAALVERLRQAAADGLWPQDFDPAIGAELVIAVVKGASLNRARATRVLAQFEQLTVRAATAGRRARAQGRRR